jgi:hypothetical protein
MTTASFSSGAGEVWALDSKGRSKQQQPAKILRKDIWFIAVIFF